MSTNQSDDEFVGAEGADWSDDPIGPEDDTSDDSGGDPAPPEDDDDGPEGIRGPTPDEVQDDTSAPEDDEPEGIRGPTPDEVQDDTDAGGAPEDDGDDGLEGIRGPTPDDVAPDTSAPEDDEPTDPLADDRFVGEEGADYSDDPIGPEDDISENDLTDQPVPTRMDPEDRRFAPEGGITIGGETYREGELLPPDEQIARDIEQEILQRDETPGYLSPDDIAVGRTDEGFETAQTETGAAQAYRQRREARRQAEQEAVEEAAERYEQRTGIDVGPEDFEYTDTRGVVFSESGQREAAAGNVIGADPEDFTAEGGTVSLTDEAARERATEDIANQLRRQYGREVEPGEDFEVVQTGDGRYSAIMTPGFVAEQTRREVSEETGLRARGQAGDRPAGFGVNLNIVSETEAAQARQAGRALSQVPYLGAVGGALQDVDRGTTATVQYTEAGQEQLAEQEYQESLEDMGPVERALQPVIGREGEVEESIMEGSAAVAERTREWFVEPAAETTGDVVDVGQQAVELVNPQTYMGGREHAAEQVGDVGEAAGDVLRGEQQEQSPVSGSEEVVEKFTGRGGAYGVVPFIAEAPRTIQSVGETGYEAAEYTYRRPTDAPGAAVSAGGQALGQAVGQAVENPIRTAGILVGTAGVMGGAAAASGRAGLATRAAIQPGEELLGYGGAAALGRGGRAISRVGDAAPGRAGAAAQRAGSGIERSGDVLFPNNEPLLFSEEAAIYAGRRAAGVARRGGRRLRGEVEGRAPDVDVDRPGPGISIETDPDAGLVDVSPEVRQAAREATVDRARRGARTVAETPQRARAGAERTAQVVSDASVDDVTAGLEGVASRVRGRAAEGVETVRGGVGRARQRTAEEYTAARFGLAERRAGMAATARDVLDLSYDDFRRGAWSLARGGYNYGYSAADRLLSGAERRTVGRVGDTGPGLSGDVALQQAFTRGSGLPAVSFGGVGQRLVGGARGLASRADAGLSAVEQRTVGRVGGTGPTVSGDVAQQQAFLRGSALPGLTTGDGSFVRGAAGRVRSGAESVLEAGEGVVGRTAFTGPTVSGDVAQQQAFLRGSGVPRLDMDVRQQLAEAGATARQRAVGAAARTRQEATALRFGLAERGRQARGAAGQLRDVTIRVGETEPGGTLFDTDFDEPPVRSQTENPLGLEMDTETDTEDAGFEPGAPTETGDGGTGGEVMIEGETGVSVQRVVETETEGEGGGARTETEPELTDGTTLRAEFGDEPDDVTGPSVETDVGTEPTVSVDQTPRLGTGVDQRPDTRVRTGLELDQETRLALEQELETETETEAETEAETETEQEVELEAETEFEGRYELYGTEEPPETPREEEPEERQTTERSALGGNLGPGWYSEYVAALALGPSAARGSPGEDVLEERPEAEAYTSTLPVEAQVSGTEAEQEAIEEAYSTLTFGGGGGDGGDGDDPFAFNVGV